MSQDPFIVVKHEQSLAYAGSEGWQAGDIIFIQIYRGLVTSGMLAAVTGNATKALIALGLSASPLGVGSAQSRAFFQDLVRGGVVKASDYGRLFCCIAHDKLAEQCGLSKNTLTRCAAELEERGMVEKRTIPVRGNQHYNLYFILQGSYLDKYSTNRPPRQATELVTVPKIGTVNEEAAVPKNGTVPGIGTNFRSSPTTTTTTTTPVQEAGSSFDPDAVLAHFAARKGVARYDSTAHDEKKLAQLKQAGYTQEEILAAIDRAFDQQPPDAPPIRMFSYCATIALVTPPRRCSAAEPGITAGPVAAAEPEEPAAMPPIPTTGEADRPISSISYVARLFEAEIGPITPLVENELCELVKQYPDPEQWDAAFREAVRANVRKLSYVCAVLTGQAARGSATLPPSGGTIHAKHTTESMRSGREERGGSRRRRPAAAGGDPRDGADGDLVAAQKRAAAVQPLDIAATLGTANA